MPSVTDELWANRRLGDFEIVREIGRGGMGVVYEARQLSLNRKVALKVLSGGLGLTAKVVQRFQREAEAAARLHHTNIVPVYATGEEDGTHFYAMELIDGSSLDQVIRQLRASRERPPPAEKPISPDLAQTGPYVEGASSCGVTAGLNSSSLGSGSGYFDMVARMVAEVADALAYAHQQGVIHRDIKPSNLLLSPAGRLSVNDFGLARLLEQPGMTLTGEFVGTPAYMSPEQITAGRTPLDHRSDIYSLGATLYELLTLQPPFTGKQRDQVLAQILHKEPKAPRKVNAQVPVDLETICLKCLEKDPDRRYQTAGALAEDLRRYVNRFAISARRAGPLTRLKKWAKRNPAVAGAGLIVLIAVAAAGFFAWRAEAEKRQRLADEQRRAEERTAEQRRAAIERGMTAALGADLGAADKAVADAEQLGASAGEVRMLRGFIAICNGRTTEAVGHLEQAVRLMPDSVAARALLAKAHGEAMNWPAARRVLDEAAGMPPRTPEDKFFLGQAISVFRPADGLALMDQALAERPSGIGHVLRAWARVNLALVTGEVADADAGLVDAELAKRLLPGNPYTLTNLTYARLAAAIAYRRAGQKDKGDEYLAAAVRDADALARFRGNFECVCARYGVSFVRDGLAGQMDMTKELREAQAATPSPGLAFLEAENLFCLGRDAEAGALADKIPNERFKAYIRLLVALGRPDGRADARRAWETFGGPGRPPADRLEAAPLLFAVGGADEVAAIARELRAGGDRFQYSVYSPAELTATLDFLEGAASEAELLRRPATSAMERGRRYYMIGWKRLGSGDRAGAEAAFRQAFEVIPLGATAWGIDRAILIRMKDSDWPRAIPAKK
jgi:serine/threonine protein kinase